jgi:hypothetical protein
MYKLRYIAFFRQVQKHSIPHSMSSLVFNFYGPKMWMVFVLIIWGLIVGTESSTLRSQLKMEENAILNSGWWNTSGAHFNISNRCNWPQISCNKAGSITKISNTLLYQNRIRFTTLNLTVFHNLESLVMTLSLFILICLKILL